MNELRGRFDLLPWDILTDIAKNFEEEAMKFGERNWETEKPISNYANDILIHIAMYLNGDSSEDHLLTLLIDAIKMIVVDQKHPELQDIPSRQTPAAEALSKTIDKITQLNIERGLITTKGVNDSAVNYK
jgi:hypothetical protein